MPSSQFQKRPCPFVWTKEGCTFFVKPTAMYHLMWIDRLSPPALTVDHLKHKTSVQSKIHPSITNNRANTSKEKPYIQYKPNASQQSRNSILDPQCPILRRSSNLRSFPDYARVTAVSRWVFRVSSFEIFEQFSRKRCVFHMRTIAANTK